MVSCGAGKGRAQSRAKPGRQPSTYTHSSTAVTSVAEGRAVYQHRHYKPALLALLRHL